MRILTAESMQKVDREAIEGLGIPSLVLMENAALGVVEAITEEFPNAGSVTIFCGPGNNGGDGLAVARHLACRGYSVTVFLVPGGQELRGDAAVQLDICRSMDMDLRDVGPGDSEAGMLDAAAAGDVIVDALFGTGLGRPLQGAFAEIVQGLNEIARPRVAVDLPSGLNGSRSGVFGPAIEADLTVSFAAPKIAHVFPPAAAYAGRVVVADLGVPIELLERAEGDLHLLTERDLRPLLTPRALGSHKGDFGHLLIVGGSEGKSGAAVLAARAAIRSGAGLVTVACPRNVLSTVESMSMESMAVALPDRGLGLESEALESAMAAAEGKTAVAIGPGMGSAGETPRILRDLVLGIGTPIVLDADGLNAFAGRLEEIAQRSQETILTPHPGELARLLDIPTEAILEDRLEAVRTACERSQAIVVLKGHLTLIADPLGGIYVNPTGNPGLATGGSGDVLTGMIGGLLAQGHATIDAVRLAVYLHGAAGDAAADAIGEAGLAAGDLLPRIPERIEHLLRS